jgi:hypothetical protein
MDSNLRSGEKYIRSPVISTFTSNRRVLSFLYPLLFCLFVEIRHRQLLTLDLTLTQSQPHFTLHFNTTNNNILLPHRRMSLRPDSTSPARAGTLLALALAAVPLAAAAAASSLSDPRPKVLHAYNGTTPAIDGILEPEEWDDADQWVGIPDWDPAFAPVLPPASPSDPQDLNLTAWVKRDAERLYFAFQIMDDVQYRVDTPAWMPGGNPSADNLTQAGWPWFGDEMEVSESC